MLFFKVFCQVQPDIKTLVTIPCRDYILYVFRASDMNFNNLPACGHCGDTPCGVIEIALDEFLDLSLRLKVPVYHL